jgi:hypothetical protein
MPIIFPLRIKASSVVQTCNACPSQWNAETFDGEYVYVRYRWGHLRIDVAPSFEDWKKHNEVRCAYGESLGDNYEGFCSWAEVVDNANIIMVNDDGTPRQ